MYLSTRNLRAYGGKLIPKWVGPYVVTEVKRSGVSVKLDLRGELGKTNPVFHVSQLKPYVVSELEWPGRLQPQRPAPELVDGETEWEVERVLGKEVRFETRKVKRVVQAPVRPSGVQVRRARQPRPPARGDCGRGGAGSVVLAEVEGLGREGRDLAEGERLQLQ